MAMQARTATAVGDAAGLLRMASADALKVLLVAGVIVGHAVMAWTDNDAWVLDEPPVREPLLTLLNLAALVGVLFAIPTFFLLAGAFSPRSLRRKGPRRYVIDRVLRLGAALVVYMALLSPVVEYVDAVNNSSWTSGFAAFLPYAWSHPSPGPLWFLEVLLVFSIGYALVRAARPLPGATRTQDGVASAGVPVPVLVAAVLLVAAACFVVRLRWAFGQEVLQDLFLAQSPAWVVPFTLGVLGAERGWLARIPRRTSRALFRIAWACAAAVVLVVSVSVGALGGDIDAFFGGATWQSAVLCALQGVHVVVMPLWLFDVFRRRVTRQGPLLRQAGRAAFVAYVVHQVVLVGTVLATRLLAWPPEAELMVAAAAAVALSFGIGALVARIPGAARFV
jgi:hypothetical protein